MNSWLSVPRSCTETTSSGMSPTLRNPCGVSGGTTGPLLRARARRRRRPHVQRPRRPSSSRNVSAYRVDVEPDRPARRRAGDEDRRVHAGAAVALEQRGGRAELQVLEPQRDRLRTRERQPRRDPVLDPVAVLAHIGVAEAAQPLGQLGPAGAVGVGRIGHHGRGGIGQDRAHALVGILGDEVGAAPPRERRLEGVRPESRAGRRQPGRGPLALRAARHDRQHRRRARRRARDLARRGVRRHGPVGLRQVDARAVLTA